MTEKKTLIIIGGVILTVVGFIIIPPLMKKYSNKLYKSRIKSEDIDFDNMGPEIVKKTKDSETEDKE